MTRSSAHPQSLFRDRERSWVLPASLVFHLTVLALFLHVRPAHIAPVRLPGTQFGSHIVLTFAPGRAPAEQNVTMPKPQVAKSRVLPKKQNPLVQDEQTASLYTPTPAPSTADATPGNDALGTGDINIALLAVFPTPKPDLSQLPHGTRGDVVLDVVIDETGRITQLKVARGLGHGVDENVIATVEQWSFHPATRNGKPVASEQELLFHYERG